MNRNCIKNVVISLFVTGSALSLCLSMTGCGAVHGTDGETLSAIGLVRMTKGQTQTEVGLGKGMDTNLSNPRANTFGLRSPAAAKAYGGNNK